MQYTRAIKRINKNTWSKYNNKSDYFIFKQIRKDKWKFIYYINYDGILYNMNKINQCKNILYNIINDEANNIIDKLQNSQKFRE